MWPDCDCVAGLQNAFPKMSYSRQSFICIHNKPHQWNDTGNSVQTSQGVRCAGGGSGRLWRKPVQGCIHQTERKVTLTVDPYIPPFREPRPLAHSHALAPFQNYSISARENLYRARREMGSSVNPPAQTVSVDPWQHALYVLVSMWWMLCWLLHCVCLVLNIVCWKVNNSRWANGAVMTFQCP